MLAKALASATAAAPRTYVEDVFSTWLYTGNGSTQTITNGVDLAGEGGLVWLKRRAVNTDHLLFDTERGGTKYLASNTTSAQTTTSTPAPVTFDASGFSVNAATANVNNNADTFASWTFRKAPGFFDVVTYTGNGTARAVAHGLGSAPGCVIIKRTDAAGFSWQVWHRSVTQTNQFGGYLNTTDAFAATGDTLWGTPTSGTPDMNSSTFSLGTAGGVNANGGTYVAYLFAHDAGGFGDSGNESVVKCGSFTADGSGSATVDLGWEPQWVLFKRSDSAQTWAIADNMRGMTTASNAHLYPNSSDAEFNNTGFFVAPTATGFQALLTVSATYIYIAIRRGPMKTPTDATTVFGLSARTGTGANATVTGGQIADLAVIKNRGALVTSSPMWSARMTGAQYLTSTSTNAEAAAATTILQSNPWDVMNGIKVGTTSTLTNASSNTFVNYLFRRAPGFFDLVCYTGTGVARTVSHNLQVAPELLIIKSRTTTDFWPVYYGDNTKSLGLSSPALPASGVTRWNSTSPTSSVFSLGADVDVNSNNLTYIAYMFATLAGVSKVGTYVGTGAALQIDCGFTAGARFVLVKRISGGTGGWIVHDTARGIISGNDPYIFLNSTTTETTTADWIDPYSAGFELSNDASSTINVNGSSYIYFSVA